MPNSPFHAINPSDEYQFTESHHQYGYVHTEFIEKLYHILSRVLSESYANQETRNGHDH